MPGLIINYVSKFKVTLEYREECGVCIPVRVHTVVISVQHSEDVSLEKQREELKEAVIQV